MILPTCRSMSKLTMVVARRSFSLSARRNDDIFQMGQPGKNWPFGVIKNKYRYTLGVFTYFCTSWIAPWIIYRYSLLKLNWPQEPILPQELTTVYMDCSDSEE